MKAVVRIVLAVVLVIGVAVNPPLSSAQTSNDGAIYIGKTLGLNLVVGPSMDRVAALLSVPKFGNDQWESDLEKEAFLWGMLADAMKQIEAPPTFQTSYEHLLAFYMNLDQAGTFMNIAVQDSSQTSIDKANEHIKLANEELQLATATLP